MNKTAKEDVLASRVSLALGVSAALCAASWAAYAEPPVAPPASIQTRPDALLTQGPKAAEGVRLVPPPQQPVPPFQPLPQEFPGIPWGSFLVFPELVFAATYDDNIYARRRDPVKDVIFTLSPSLVAKSNWKRHALNFEIGGDLDRYRDHGQENVNDYWAGFDGRYDLGPLSNIFGGARISRDHEDRSVPGALSAAQQIEPTRFDRTEAHLGFATGTGPWRLRFGGTYDEYDYKDGLSTSGASIDSDFRDRSVHSVGLRLSYVISPGYEVFGQYATDTRSYRNNIAGLSFNRDSDGYRVAAGLRFNLPQPAVRGEVFAGRLRQDFDAGGFASVSAPYYGALVTWRATRFTTVTGFIDRSLEETTVFEGATYASSSVDTTFGFNAEHKLNSELSLSARAAYTRSTFQGFDRRDSIVDAGAGLRYYFTPTMFMGVDLRLIDRNSNVLDAQYSRNQVMLSVGYTPARSRNYSIISDDAAAGSSGLYSGFYAGADLGHGALTTNTSGPRGGGGFDSGDMGSFGESYALFAGWGREIGNWYLGVELEAGDGNARWHHRKDKDDSRTMFVDEESGYGVSARVGYLLDGGLLYGKVGRARTDFRTYYTENQFAAGAFDRSHAESGTRWGIGVDVPAAQNWFVRMGYSYTDFGDYEVPYQSGAASVTTEKFDLRSSRFSVGLGWRFGGVRAEPARRPAEERRGFYAGAGVGHGTFGTKLTGIHRDQSTGPYDFLGDFADSGGGVGFFAGYGHTLNRVYVGVEVEAEAANFGWYHDRQTSGGGGRDFAVEKRGGYGGAVRLGYVLPNGSLLYGRIGQVRTRFNTIYTKGASAAQWIDRTDRVHGTRFGVGAEVPATRNAFVRLDYTYTKYDSYGFTTGHDGGANADVMAFSNRENLFRVGVGFRF